MRSRAFSSLRSGRSALTLLLLVLIWAPPCPSYGGGAILYEIGTPDVGLAAAGYAARAQDAATVFTNPAGMTRLKRFELIGGLQALYADVSFAPGAGTSVPGGGTDGGNAIGWLPGASLFLAGQVTERLHVGFGILNYFGSSLSYDDDWVGRYYAQKATTLGVTFTPAAAYKVTDWLSIGAGLNAMLGVLDEEVAINNLAPSVGDGQMKANDTAWGFGANVGILLEPRAGTRLGVTYLSPVSLDFETTPSFTNLGPGLSTILQSRGLLTSRLDLGLQVPQTVMVSVYHELSETVSLLGNVGWQDWSQFGEVQIGVVSSNPTSLTTNLNFQDTAHVAIGAQFRPTELWLFSAGFAYDSSAVSDENRTVTFPVGAQYRFALGTQYHWTPGLVLGFAYEFLYGGDPSVSQFRGPLSGRVVGDYPNLNTSFLTLNLTWRP